MDPSPDAAVELDLRWEGPDARHRARRVLRPGSPGLDGFPPGTGVRAGSEADAAVQLPAGALVPEHDPGLVRRLDAAAVVARSPRPLRTGRFYPRGMLAPVLGGDPRDLAPLRCREAGAREVVVDLNHPLAGVPLSLAVTAREPGAGAPGDAVPSRDIAREATAGGPGMQMRLPGRATDFGGAAGLTRADDADDAAFYARPRLVHHLDARAREEVSRVYARHLREGMRVLDLMTSWRSHLPAGVGALEVTGLGMNAEELRENPQLSSWLVQDLNGTPALPFDAGAFDAAVCTVSVEYLTRPREVMAEMARVLRPGAPFVLTFSERWFPPKVVRVWLELHPFERMGLVADYLLEAGFTAVATESLHGLPRPPDDPYAGRLAESDPVYTVAGRAPGG